MRFHLFYFLHEIRKDCNTNMITRENIHTMTQKEIQQVKDLIDSKLLDALFDHPQILEMIDSNLLFEHSMSCSQKNKLVFEKLCYSFSKYPDAYGDNPIQILHISRDTCFEGYPSFYHYLMTWDRARGWRNCEEDIPTSSGLIQVLGSGKDEFLSNYKGRYQFGANQSTSRNVFHCFIDTLDNIRDYHCGGAPQLVGIYRKPFTSAQNYGIIYNNRRYYLGMEIPKDASFDKIEWRNELFERCNGITKSRIAGAAKQNDPLHR